MCSVCSRVNWWTSRCSGCIFYLFPSLLVVPLPVYHRCFWFLQRWFLRHSSAAFSVLEYIHPVSLMLAPHRHVSTHCSLIVTLHLVGAVFYPIAGVVCCCYGVSGCVCPCAPSPVFGGFS